MRKSRFLVAAAACLLAASLVEAGPLTEISRQLRGLHVTYDTDSTTVRTLLFTTNHEAYAVICDAEMTTDKDQKQKLTETRIPAGQTIPFTFHYAKSTSKIHLYLMCIPSEEKAVVEAKGKVDGTLSEQSDDRIVIKKLAKPAEETAKKVPVEDLERF